MRRLYFTLLMLCCAHFTQAQILFPVLVYSGTPPVVGDAFGYGDWAKNATTGTPTYLDVSITVPTNTNYIALGAGYTNQYGVVDSVTITNSTIKGTRLTDVGYGAGGNGFLAVWEMKGALPTGAQTIRVHWSSGGGKDVGVVVMAFTTTNATTPSKSAVTGSGSAASVSRAVTCNTGDIMVGFTLTAYRTITGSGSTTVLAPYASADAYNFVYGMYEVAGASDKTISWDLSSANPQWNVTFAVQP